MNVLLRRVSGLLFLTWALTAASLMAVPPEALGTFTAKSFSEIKKAQAGKAFILAFWSVTCEPCREEMMILADVHRRFPQVPIILVAADPPGTRPAVLRFLANHALGQIETRQFDADSPERLRYSVDKSWTGELPRSYFFNAAHEPTAHSGVVEEKWLKAWLETATASAPQRKPGA